MENQDTKELIQWHAGFRGAIKTELADAKDILSYEDEKSVGKKELKIDLLIIKKKEDGKVLNPIGHIFKKHNILEYKSPSDYLSINDFYKVYAYACLYKSDDDKADPIGIDELTISFILNHFPRELVKHLSKLKKFIVKQYQAGIYHVSGDSLPIQIIITSELSGKEHRWLKILTNKVTKDQIRDVLSDYEISSKDTYKDAVIDIVTKVNNRYIKKWKELQKVEKTTLELGKIILIRKKLQKGYDLITISDHIELDLEYVKKITNLIFEYPNESDEGIVKLIQN